MRGQKYITRIIYFNLYNILHMICIQNFRHLCFEGSRSITNEDLSDSCSNSTSSDEEDDEESAMIIAMMLISAG